MSDVQQPASLMPRREPFADTADRLRREIGFVWPWVWGNEGIYPAPIVLPASFKDELYEMAEAVARLYDELVGIVLDEPALIDEFFNLTPHQKLMWEHSAGFWHGFSRLDVFYTRQGRLQMAEFNADTPTGQFEAVRFGEFFAPDYPELEDPNVDYGPRFIDLVRRIHAVQVGPDAPLDRVGVIFPTDLPEDLNIIQLYRDWCAQMGAECVLGSPYNLSQATDGRLLVFGGPVDVVMRHYKTDWWAERPQLLRDEEPLPDNEPLHGPLTAILGAEQRRQVSVVNPFGSLLPQNKLAMAFFYEHLGRFGAEAQQTIERYVPRTLRAETLGVQALRAERERWVLKSDYGCEGEEVFVGLYTDPQEWDDVVARLEPGHWIAQHFFEILPIDRESVPNYGVYLVAGVASGLYIRLDPIGAATDERTRAVPAFVAPT